MRQTTAPSLPERTDALPDTQWTALESPSLETNAATLALRASQAWVKAGMSGAKASMLQQDLTTILVALFKPDFDRYDRLMTSKGATLGANAGPFVDAVVEWKLYSPDIPTLATSSPVLERLRYVWNHPAERDVQWRAMRSDSLMVGFGLLGAFNTMEWPYEGDYAQLTFYVPSSGRLTEVDGKRLNKTKDAAWVMLEGRFASGMQTRMKINFYYDENASTWFPVTVVFGLDKEHRPFPMQ